MLLSGLIGVIFFIVQIPRLAIILVRELYGQSSVFIYGILFIWGMLKMANCCSYEGVGVESEHFLSES